MTLYYRTISSTPPTSGITLDRIGKPALRPAITRTTVPNDPTFPQAINLSAKDFSWLHDEAWEPDDLEYFASRLRPVQRQINERPPYQQPGHSGRRGRSTLLGFWLLRELRGDAQGIAEVQGFCGSFSAVQVVLSADPTNPLLERAIPLLISGLFLHYELATIVLGMAHREDEDAALQRGFYIDCETMPDTVQTLWSPTRIERDFVGSATSASSLEAGETARIAKIDATTWWTTSRGRECRAALAYIERRRVQAASRERTRAATERHKSLIQILFGRR